MDISLKQFLKRMSARPRPKTKAPMCFIEFRSTGYETRYQNRIAVYRLIDELSRTTVMYKYVNSKNKPDGPTTHEWVLRGIEYKILNLLPTTSPESESRSVFRQEIPLLQVDE